MGLERWAGISKFGGPKGPTKAIPEVMESLAHLRKGECDQMSSEGAD